jgi:acyl carrier protein
VARTFTREGVRETVFAILREHAPEGASDGPDVTLDSTITGDLALDSLAVMEVVAAVEDHFAIVIPDEILPEMRTVADVIAALEARLSAKGTLE